MVAMTNGNIILCGFMGCGKTSVGKRAARLLGRKFVDLDQYIEERAGMTVTEIFARFGEEGFREREAKAVKEVAKRRNLVIASGGGTVLKEANVAALHESGGLILYLDAPLPALQERLKRDKKRPLLQVPDRRKVIEELHAKRSPLYQAAADLTVDAGAPPITVAKRVEAAYRAWEEGQGRPQAHASGKNT